MLQDHSIAPHLYEASEITIQEWSENLSTKCTV